MFFRKKSGGFQVSFLFSGDHRQYKLVYARKISSWVRKILSIAKTCMFLGTHCGAAVSVALVVGVSPVFILLTGPESLLKLETIFHHKLLPWKGTRIQLRMLALALVSRQLVTKCQNIHLRKVLWICWVVSLPNTEKIVHKLSVLY